MNDELFIIHVGSMSPISSLISIKSPGDEVQALKRAAHLYPLALKKTDPKNLIIHAFSLTPTNSARITSGQAVLTSPKQIHPYEHGYEGITLIWPRKISNGVQGKSIRSQGSIFIVHIHKTAQTERTSILFFGRPRQTFKAIKKELLQKFPELETLSDTLYLSIQLFKISVKNLKRFMQGDLALMPGREIQCWKKADFWRAYLMEIKKGRFSDLPF